MSREEEIARKAQTILDPSERAQYLRDQNIELPRVVNTTFPAKTVVPEGPGSDQLVTLGQQPDTLVTKTKSPLLPIESDATRTRQLTRAAIIKADLDEVNELEALKDLEATSAGLTGKQVLKGQSDRRFELEEEVLKEQALDFPEGTDPTLRIQATQEILNEDAQRKQEFDAAALAFVNSLTGPLTTEDQLEREAVAIGFAEELAELDDTISGLDIAGEVALEIAFLPKFLLDNFQASGTVNPVEAKEVISNLITNFKRLSPSEQKRIFPVVKEDLLDQLPDSRALEILRVMTDPSIDEGLALAQFQEFAIIDIVAAALGLKAIASGLRKSQNAIKLAKRLGNADKAARLNTTVLIDETGEAASKLDIDQLTAADNAMPFNTAEFNESIAEELSGKAQDNIFAFRRELSNTVDNLEGDKFFLREGLLADDDRAKVAQGVLDQFDKGIAKELAGEGRIVDMKKVGSDSNSMDFEITISDEAGELIETRKLAKTFALNDIGRFEEVQTSALADKIGSPRFNSAGSNLTDTVKAAQRLDNTTELVATQFRNQMKQIRDPIRKSKGNTKRRSQEVDEVLIYGDEVGEVFSPTDLRAGVNGIRLDDAQIETYVLTRDLLESWGRIRGNQDRRLRLVKGDKTVKLFDGDEGLAFGNPAKEVTDAEQMVRRGGFNEVFDKEIDQVVRVDDLDLDTVYALGKKLVKLEDSAKFGEAGLFRHVIVSVDDLSELPSQTLRLRTAYVHKSNPRANWFVQKFTPTTIDGVRTNARTVVRSFDTRVEADRYARRLQGDADQGVTFDALEDAEVEKLKIGSSGNGSSKGAFYGARKEEGVPFGLPEDQLDEVLGPKLRRGAFETLSLYGENLSKLVSRSEWRVGTQRKWENTARSLIPLAPDHSFNTGLVGATGEKADFLNKWRTQINEWAGFTTKSERWWEALVQRSLERAVPKGRGKFVEVLHTVRHKDPAAALRSATFHSLLGAFNPIQLFVQAQGASVSAAVIGPLRLPGLLRKQMGLRLIQNMTIKDGPMFNSIAKIHGWKPDELRIVKELWDRTGLHQSLLTNADVEAAGRGFPTTSLSLKKVFDKGLLFYREGEGFNRRLAFMAALDEAGDLRKLSKDDDVFRTLLSRVSDLTLGLSKANRASFQKGLASIPTQFFQVVAKTYENLINLNVGVFKGGAQVFTPKDKAKILIGQFALYGTAGIPLGNLGLKYALDTLGTDQMDIDDPANLAIVKGLNGGFWDVMTFFVLNADLEVGKRASLIQGFNDLVISLSTDSVTPTQLIMGPSFSMFNEFWQKLFNGGTAALMVGSIESVFAQKPTFDNTLDSMAKLAEVSIDLGLTPFSSWRNWQKARFVANIDRKLDRSGAVVSDRDFTWQEEMGVRMGFQLGDSVRDRELSKTKSETAEYVNALSGEMLNIFMHQFLRIEEARKNGTVLSDADNNAVNIALKNILNGADNHIMAEKVMESYQRKINKMISGESKLERSVRDALTNYSTDLVKAGESIINSGRLTPTVTELEKSE